MGRQLRKPGGKWLGSQHDIVTTLTYLIIGGGRQRSRPSLSPTTCDPAGPCTCLPAAVLPNELPLLAAAGLLWWDAEAESRLLLPLWQDAEAGCLRYLTWPRV